MVLNKHTNNLPNNREKTVNKWITFENSEWTNSQTAEEQTVRGQSLFKTLHITTYHHMKT